MGLTGMGLTGDVAQGDDAPTHDDAPTRDGAEPAFLYTPAHRRAILAATGVMAVATMLLLASRAIVNEPERRSQELIAWGLASAPLGIPVLLATLRPVLGGHAANRSFWRWWFAGDVASLAAGLSIPFGIDRGGVGLPMTTLVMGALVLPLWGGGGVVMLRQKSGKRTVGIDLVDTAVAVVTLSALGVYALIAPILGAEDSVFAVPFALAMVGAPAGLYLAYTNFTRLPKGWRTPQGIAIGIAAAMYTNVGYQAVNAVRDFSLPILPGIALQMLTGALLVAFPLFTHTAEVPGLDRLPLARQVRRPSPLVLLPLLVLPFLALNAWQEHEGHPSRMAFVTAVIFSVLVLSSVRSLLANRETRRLYAELEAASVELEHRAAHDELTGLITRRRITEVIDDAVGRQRRSSAPLALLYVDLDGFKVVNDNLGHKAGDDVLREVATRLTAAVRYSDTVARLGGDEFVKICESAGTLAEAQTIAERVVTDLAEPIVTSSGPATIGASVGVAYAEADVVAGTDWLLREADEAMYAAKQSGRGQVSTTVLGA